MGQKANIGDFMLYAICLLHSVLYAYAATGKIMDLDGFGDQLDRSLLPDLLVEASAVLVPVIEYTLAVALLWGRFQLKALYASLVLLAFFTGYLVIVLNFSDSIPCSCGGLFPSMGWTAHIKLNTGLMILALLGIFWGRDHSKNRTNRYTT